MPILSFEYENLDTGWKLEKTSFGDLNLLVGPSGVGKTLILRALRDVRQAALAGVQEIPSSKWNLQIKMNEIHFSWEAETRDLSFVSEQIARDGTALVKRNKDIFHYGVQKLPKLNLSESAIKLLDAEEAIEPLYDGLRLWRSLGTEFFKATPLETIQHAEIKRMRLGDDLDDLKSDMSSSSFLKLYLLQQGNREVFDRILEEFSDVFDTVLDLRVAMFEELGVQLSAFKGHLVNHLAVGLREEGVEGWVVHLDWSSGMAKTLKFIIETALATQGTVLFIDELEGGLGVNCLPKVAGRMLQGLDRIQYIATSHHPRVINGIPYRRWKLVTRRGSQVRVLDAEDIPALRASSSLERFTELINLPEYVEGVA